MKLWLSKTSEVPLQEQLSTQLILGIVSADLAPGERLPSTSQVARRFQIHANTVRAAYRDLVRRGWADWKRGSGFYVRVSGLEKKLDSSLDLDRLISALFEIARGNGHSTSEIQSRIKRWLDFQPPDHVLVIEPDVELREILMAEIQAAAAVRVVGASLKECLGRVTLSGALCVALYNHAAEVQAALPAQSRCVFMRSRSIPQSLAGELRPSSDVLVTVISRWPGFLQWARATLSAVGIDSAALDLRDARGREWKRGLTNGGLIIADSVVSRELPRGCRARVFRLIADNSITEIRQNFPAATSAAGSTSSERAGRPRSAGKRSPS